MSQEGQRGGRLAPFSLSSICLQHLSCWSSPGGSRGCRPRSFARRGPWEGEDGRSCCWTLLAAPQRPGEAGRPEFTPPAAASSELRARAGGLCSLLGHALLAWPLNPIQNPLAALGRGGTGWKVISALGSLPSLLRIQATLQLLLCVPNPPLHVPRDPSFGSLEGQGSPLLRSGNEPHPCLPSHPRRLLPISSETLRDFIFQGTGGQIAGFLIWI